MEIKIHLPDDVAEYGPDLEFFMSLMVRKLYMNRHRGWADNMSINDGLEGVAREFEEMVDAIRGESSFSAIVEAVDVANMALIVYLTLSRQIRPQYEAQRGNIPRLKIVVDGEGK